MINFLKQVGLIDAFQLTMNVDKTEFIKTLIVNLDEPQADFFDVFSGGKNIYKGKVEYDQFTMKRKKRFFDSAFRSARVNGKLSTHHDKVIIDIEIHAFYKFFIPIAIVMAVFYGFAISAMLIGDNAGIPKVFGTLFIFVHGAFMFGIPYFMMKRSVSNTRHEIERDLYFMMKDKIHAGA